MNQTKIFEIDSDGKMRLKNSTTIVELLILSEILEKYGHLLENGEVEKLIKFQEQSSPKHQKYLEAIEKSVDETIEKMLNENQDSFRLKNLL